MQIQKYDNISYKGLTKSLGKDLYSYGNIKKLRELYKKSNPNGIVGSLPHQWVKNMPYENRGENIKEFYIQIGKLVQNIEDIDFFTTALTKLLKKYHAINHDDVIDVMINNGGAFSRCYKIINSNPEQPTLFLKKFKKWTYPEVDWAYKHRHGTECEINTKDYVKTNLRSKNDKKYFSKFYYGDIENKYYIENYVESFFDKEQEQKLIYSNKNLLKNFQVKILQILKRIGLRHNDLSTDNMVYCVSPRGKTYPVCCDLGGVQKIAHLPSE